MRPVVWLMERLLTQPPLTSQQLKMLDRDNIAKLDAVEEWFGFRPTPLGQEIGCIRWQVKAPVGQAKESSIS